MWSRVKRTLGTLALGLALFICVWVSRIFLAGPIVGSFMPLAGKAAIAWIAVVGGAVPALPLGLTYGLMRGRGVLSGAGVVAVLACALELATSSVAVPWWTFVTWWVLPLECVTVLAFFVIAALVGSRLMPGVRPVVRSRVGACTFVMLTVGALTGPWLYSCLRLNVCSLVP
jgi:hypothetical protein